MSLLRSAFRYLLHPLLPICPPLSGHYEQQVVLFPRWQLPWWHTTSHPHTAITLLTFFLLLPDGWCHARKRTTSPGQVTARVQACRCLANENSHVKYTLLLCLCWEERHQISLWSDLDLNELFNPISQKLHITFPWSPLIFVYHLAASVLWVSPWQLYSLKIFRPWLAHHLKIITSSSKTFMETQLNSLIIHALAATFFFNLSCLMKLFRMFLQAICWSEVMYFFISFFVFL